MRKISAMALAVLLAMSLCTGAAAADYDYEMLGASAKFGDGGYLVNGKEQRGFIEDFAMLYNTTPGTWLFLPLRTADFSWEKGTARPDMTPASNRILQFGIDVSYTEGAQAFDRIAIATRDEQIGILIDFADIYPHLEELEFEVECALTSQGGIIDGGEFTVAGTLANRHRNVYSATKEVELGAGRAATGYGDHYGLVFNLGSGVTLTGDLLWGQTVYGAATQTPTQADKELMAQHPGITKAVRLDTIGLKGKVRINTGEAGEMHVYALDLTYLGTTAGPLPLERVYYLAPQKL